MAISVSCDECGEEFQVKDEAAGKRVKCRTCGAPVKVPDDEWGAAPAPRRAARRPSARPAQGGGLPGWIIPVGIVGFVALLGVILLASFVMRRPAAVAVNPANPLNPAVKPPAAGGNPAIPGGKAADPDAAFEVAWSAGPDAPATKVEWPAALAFDVPLQDDDPFYAFPLRASPFVAADLGAKSRGVGAVWNLATGQKKASLKTQGAEGERGVLSPDGDYLIVDEENKKDQPPTLWSFKTGERVKLALDAPTEAKIYDFGPPGQAVLWTSDAKMVVLDAATGGVVRRFDVVKPKSFRPALAISPGGKYAALAGEGKGVHLFDVTTGKPAGRVKLGGDDSPDADGVAFSPDGTRLSCLFIELNKTTLTECDMATGRSEVVFTTPGQVSAWNANGYTYDGAYLEYLADDRGWVLMGDVVVDRRSKDVVWRFPYSKTAILAEPRFAAASSVVIGYGPAGARRLKAFPVPWDRIDAALAQTDPSALLFGPGVGVRLDVQIGTLANGGQPDPTKTELENALKQMLESRKIPLAADGAAVLRVAYSEKVGPNMQFTSFGVGNLQKSEYPSTLGAAVVTMATADGSRTVYSETINNVEPDTGFFKGEMSAARLRESMLKRMQTRFHALALPRIVPKDPNGQAVPGLTQVP